MEVTDCVVDVAVAPASAESSDGATIPPEPNPRPPSNAAPIVGGIGVSGAESVGVVHAATVARKVTTTAMGRVLMLHPSCEVRKR